jgi:hypothetical protein
LNWPPRADSEPGACRAHPTLTETGKTVKIPRARFGKSGGSWVARSGNGISRVPTPVGAMASRAAATLGLYPAPCAMHGDR